MKKLLFLASIIMFIAQSMFAQIRYNPLNNLLYSYPETPSISQDEYRMLLLICIELEARMIAINGGVLPRMKDVLSQCDFYLKGVGTPTALRLIADLKDNAVYYANGDFMNKLF